MAQREIGATRAVQSRAGNMDQHRKVPEGTCPSSNTLIPKEEREANNKREIKDASHDHTEPPKTGIRPPQTGEVTTDRERWIPPRSASQKETQVETIQAVETSTGIRCAQSE